MTDIVQELSDWLRSDSDVDPNSDDGLELMSRARDTIAQLRDALAGLLDWGREHTSPLDQNSPHELLIKAATVLDKAGR